MTETGGGFITSPPQSAPESPFVPPTPASTETTLASPPQARTKTNRPITAREEALLISNLDDQLTTITSRFTRRHNEGGYTSLKRLSKDYHVLLQTLLHHSPAPSPFMTAQYLIRIVGDLNEQIPSLPIPGDPRGLFYILKELDETIVANLQISGMSVTERVRLRNELERGRLVIVQAFEEYKGRYDVEEVLGRVYERSLEEMEEPFGVETRVMVDYDDVEGRLLQEGVLDDEIEDG